jgi:rubredoxin
MAKYICPGCGYTYDEVKGNEWEGFPAGTKWEAIPDDWSCPECSVRDKPDFNEVNSEAEQ